MSYRKEVINVVLIFKALWYWPSLTIWDWTISGLSRAIGDQHSNHYTFVLSIFALCNWSLWHCFVLVLEKIQFLFWDYSFVAKFLSSCVQTRHLKYPYSCFSSRFYLFVILIFPIGTSVAKSLIGLFNKSFFAILIILLESLYSLLAGRFLPSFLVCVISWLKSPLHFLFFGLSCSLDNFKNDPEYLSIGTALVSISLMSFFCRAWFQASFTFFRGRLFFSFFLHFRLFDGVCFKYLQVFMIILLSKRSSDFLI